jgi:hypothetical protein
VSLGFDESLNNATNFFNSLGVGTCLLFEVDLLEYFIVLVDNVLNEFELVFVTLLDVEPNEKFYLERQYEGF